MKPIPQFTKVFTLAIIFLALWGLPTARPAQAQAAPTPTFTLDAGSDMSSAPLPENSASANWITIRTEGFGTSFHDAFWEVKDLNRDNLNRQWVGLLTK